MLYDDDDDLYTRVGDIDISEEKKVSNNNLRPSRNVLATLKTSTALTVKALKKHRRQYCFYPFLVGGGLATTFVGLAVYFFKKYDILSQDDWNKYNSLVDQYNNQLADGTPCTSLQDIWYIPSADYPVVAIDVCQAFQDGIKANLIAICSDLLKEACDEFKTIQSEPHRLAGIAAIILILLSIAALIVPTYYYGRNRRKIDEITGVENLQETAENLGISLHNTSLSQLTVNFSHAQKALKQNSERRCTFLLGAQERNLESALHRSFFKNEIFDPNLLSTIFDYADDNLTSNQRMSIVVEEEEEGKALYNRLT